MSYTTVYNKRVWWKSKATIKKKQASHSKGDVHQKLSYRWEEERDTVSSPSIPAKSLGLVPLLRPASIWRRPAKATRRSISPRNKSTTFLEILRTSWRTGSSMKSPMNWSKIVQIVIARPLYKDQRRKRKGNSDEKGKKVKTICSTQKIIQRDGTWLCNGTEKRPYGGDSHRWGALGVTMKRETLPLCKNLSRFKSIFRRAIQTMRAGKRR